MTRRRLIQLALAVALVLALAMALLPEPLDFKLDALDDKYQHMLAFAVLAGLATLSYPQASLWRIAERLSFLGALIEVIQSIPALQRDCDIRDWLADTAAIAAVLLLVASARAIRRTHQAGPKDGAA